VIKSEVIGIDAGLAEAWLGAGRRFSNFILLTLGTGVGGTIILFMRTKVVWRRWRHFIGVLIEKVKIVRGKNYGFG